MNAIVSSQREMEEVKGQSVLLEQCMLMALQMMEAVLEKEDKFIFIV